MSQTQTQTENLLAAGTKIDGRYEILDKLGSGGFATVYRGWQLNLDQPVAIKVLNVPPGAPESFVERFYREARTAAQIRHPDVVTIFDYGVTEDGRPYIILELLEGDSIEEELTDRGPMAPQRILRLFTRCLDALQAAHDLGIVHRDLKPANLFLTGAGTRVETLRVLDFGIAYMLDDRETRLTGTGQFLGTPQYLAPEYIEDHGVTPALDVYQMGLILVEMFTGGPVVNSDNTYQCILRHCSGKLDLPMELIGSPLGPVLKRALSRDVNERYPDAGAFRDALEAIDPASLPPMPFQEEWKRRGPSSQAPTAAYGDQVTAGEAASLLKDSHDALALKPTLDSRTPLPDDVPSPEDEADPWPTAPAPDPMEAATVDPIRALPSPDAPAPTPASAPATEIPPPPTQVPPSNTTALIAAGVGALVVLLIGGGILLMLGDGEEIPRGDSARPSEPAEAKQEAAPEAEVKAEAVADKAADGEQPEEKPAEEAPAKPEEVRVTVKATPDTASIYQGDTLLGAGTVEVPFASKEAEAVTLTIQAEGHQDATLEVSPSGDAERTVALEETPEPRSAAARRAAAAARRNAAAQKNDKATTTKPADADAAEKKTTKKPSMGFVDDNKAPAGGKGGKTGGGKTMEFLPD